ncbi:MULTISPECIES: sortase B protein-sorting domain-containing protein [Diaphorobacter]
MGKTGDASRMGLFAQWNIKPRPLLFPVRVMA